MTDELTTKEMIERLLDMGKYWDDGLPTPSQCADRLTDLVEQLDAMKAGVKYLEKQLDRYEGYSINRD